MNVDKLKQPDSALQNEHVRNQERQSTTVSYIEPKKFVNLKGITGCAVMDGLEVSGVQHLPLPGEPSIVCKMGNNWCPYVQGMPAMTCTSGKWITT